MLKKLFLFCIVFSLLAVTTFSSITPKETTNSFESTGIFVVSESEINPLLKLYSSGTYNVYTKTFTDSEGYKYCM